MSRLPKQVKKSNRLIIEKSPYLLQHAYNPVDWYPWGDEAFAKAKAEDKPIFVSIGYSSCHWCHVMEKECFDDEEVAKIMNKVFVSIKVDREERPDLDGAYMTVCQVMGRNCGWPLNVIMTHEKNPFFITSYIPKYTRNGAVGMIDLVPQVNKIWNQRRGELEEISEGIKRRLDAFKRRMPPMELNEEVLDSAYKSLSQEFDGEHGGFGSAPKFPTPHKLLFLLRYWRRTGNPEALVMVKKTLRCMRLGGIFDQLGFGFHRYSTDAEWLVPHFEKMLYDQALLTLAYLETYQASGEGKFKVTAKELMEFVIRDLESPEGGFYSAVDADSEGEEGKFYLWTEQEIRDILPLKDAELAVKLFEVKSQGNYNEPGTGHTARNILHFAKTLDDLASEFRLTSDLLIARLGKIQKKLFEAREKRVTPAKDDKILTDWNGLMIAALARASQVLGEKRYLQVATKAADFLLETMKDENGVLYHRYVKGERAIEGFLDDFAFLAFGLTEIYEASFDESYLKAAFELIDLMVERFWDEKEGGFSLTVRGSADVIIERKEVYDGALPSGNSVALFDLLRLTRLSENPRYQEMASRLRRTFSAQVVESPSAHTFLLLGIDFAFGPAYSATVVGHISEQDTIDLLNAFKGNYLPNVVVSLKHPSRSTFGYKQVNSKATAYVCRRQTCFPPTNSPEKMLELLDVPSSMLKCSEKGY